MPSITQIEYIISVDKYKNFSKAAREKNVSQPSLSSQIQKVEDELGFIIFDRSKKPIVTTKKGHSFINQGKNVLREHKKIFEIKNSEGVLSGDFNLGVIPSLSPYVIPLFIKSFSKKYPNVKLIINEYKTDDIIKLLYEDAIDGALLVTPLSDEKIIERVLFYERFFVFVSDNHKLFQKKSISDSDLDTSSVWLLEEGHCFRDQVIRVCSLNGRKNVLDNISFASGNLETLVNLIRRGDGYTLLPELAVNNLPEKEKLQNIIKFKKPIPTREVSIVSSRSFLKQDIIEAIEKEIILNLPKSVKSLKKDSINIIDI